MYLTGEQWFVYIITYENEILIATQFTGETVGRRLELLPVVTAQTQFHGIPLFTIYQLFKAYISSGKGIGVLHAVIMEHTECGFIILGVHNELSIVFSAKLRRVTGLKSG